MTQLHPFTEENNVKFNNIIDNLESISSIKVYDKLYIVNNVISIHSPKTFIGIIRWWYKYNRSDTVGFLISMFNDIDSLLSILTFIIDNQKPRRKQQRRTRRYKVIIKKKSKLIDFINRAEKGLQNIIITYSNDEDFCNSINKVLDKYRRQYSQQKIKQP